MPSALSEFPCWSTCLRSLIFVPPERATELTDLRCKLDSVVADSVERYVDQEMYSFLLEVVCGLHSPLLGETEVLGQFRLFMKLELAKPQSWVLRWNGFFQSLLSDAKELREKHLTDLGSQSYGSLTRKMIKNSTHVSLWGSGQLAAEIAPWLEKQKLNVFCRTPRNEQQKTLTVGELKNHSRENEILVIAAPLDNGQIRELILQSGNRYSLVLDWRGEDHLNEELKVLSVNIKKYIDFSSLMRAFEIEKKGLEDRLKPARAAIESKVATFNQRSHVRPLGWDDLCA